MRLYIGYSIKVSTYLLNTKKLFKYYVSRDEYNMEFRLCINDKFRRIV